MENSGKSGSKPTLCGSGWRSENGVTGCVEEAKTQISNYTNSVRAAVCEFVLKLGYTTAWFRAVLLGSCSLCCHFAA